VCGLAAHCGRSGLDWLNRFEYRGQPQSDTITWNEEKAAQWKAATSGPPTCEKFESVNPGGCKGCRHMGQITTPVQLGRAQRITGGGPREDRYEVGGSVVERTESPAGKAEEGWPALPAPWAWSETRQLIFTQEDNSGQPDNIVVSEYAIHLAGVRRAETIGMVSYIFRQFLPHHGWHEISVSAATFFSARGVSELAAGGAVIRDHKLFSRYVHDALVAWHRDHPMSELYEQYGWKANDTAFLVGRNLYTANGVEIVSVSDELAARAHLLGPSEGGDIRLWASTANKLFGGHMPSLLALLASFAAPLMRFHTKYEGGAILSLLNSGSGTGKTTTLEGAMSIWGDPQGLSLTNNDTLAAKGLSLAAAGNLPVMYDELAGIMSKRDPDALKSLVEIVSSGHDRRRALQHGAGLRHSQGTWQLNLLTASNRSIVDMLDIFANGTDAPGWRILEVNANYPQRFDYATGDHLKATLFENAGHAGAAFLSHLLKPEVLKFARKALAQYTEEIWRSTQWKSEARFIVRLLGAIAVAGDIVRSLGLLSVDPPEVVRWAIDQVGHRAEKVTGEPAKEQQKNSAIAILDEFLREHLRDTLRVQGAWRAGDAKIEPAERPNRLLVRYERQTDRVFVPSKTFRSWVVGQGHSWGEVSSGLTDAHILVDRKRMITLGAGTTLASAQTVCLEFDLGHPAASQTARLLRTETTQEKQS
jgi:hypothetical protein